MPERSHERHRDHLVSMSPEEGLQRFLEQRQPSVAESTYQNNRTTLEQFVAWLHDQDVEDLNDLTGRMLADYVHHRRQKVKPISLQKELSAIRLRWTTGPTSTPSSRLRERVSTRQRSSMVPSRET